MKPLLSICIPTYNRAHWLRSSLWNWLPQVERFGDEVELIVSDNASSEPIQSVIDEAAEWGKFTYHRQPENFGVIKNVYLTVKDLAQSEFVWIVGDDDLPKSDAVEKVLAALKASPSVNFVYVNYSVGIPFDAAEIIDSDRLDYSELPCNHDFEPKLVPHLADLLKTDDAFFTPLLSSVWLRKDAIAAYQVGLHTTPYETMESTIPHALYIAKNLLQIPARHTGAPLIKLGLDTTWNKHRPFYILEIVPSFFDLLEAQGVNKKVVKELRQKILGTQSCGSLIQLIHERDVPMHGKFSFFKFFNKHYLYPRFWRTVGEIALYELNMMKRFVLQSTLKRPYLLKKQ